MSAFTSKRKLIAVNPPRPDGPIVPNPYSGYELIENQPIPKHSLLTILLQRWRTLSASNLFDFWEKLFLDSGMVLFIIFAVFWGLSTILKQ